LLADGIGKFKFKIAETLNTFENQRIQISFLFQISPPHKNDVNDVPF
jgi:hypothetical protein